MATKAKKAKARPKAAKKAVKRAKAKRPANTILSRIEEASVIAKNLGRSGLI